MSLIQYSPVILRKKKNTCFLDYIMLSRQKCDQYEDELEKKIVTEIFIEIKNILVSLSYETHVQFVET